MYPISRYDDVLGLPQGLLSVRDGWNTSLERYPGVSETDVEHVTELLSLSLRECPAPLRRKLILAPCIRDLVLSVISQSS